MVIDTNWINESEDNKEDETVEWAQRSLHICCSQAKLHEESDVRIKPFITILMTSIQV